MNKSLENRLKLIAGDSNVRCDEPMSSHCTFRAGGTAKYYVIPDEYKKVRDVLRLCVEENIPYYVIGNGSNLLVQDDGFDGVIIEIDSALAKIEINGNEIVAKAGAKLSKIAVKALNESLTGFEFAHGIPGNLGGAVTMNAGAYGGEMKDVLKWVKVLDNNGEMKTLKAEELELGYRTSIIVKEKMIVLEACIELHEGNRDEIEMHMKELMAKRKEKQPLEYPSAGSTFKRPEGYFAGKLIQDAGLKGYRVGGAMVSEKHSGFVINYDNATATDIINLMKDVRKKVYEEFQVTLEPEVKILPAVKW
ncbi:MULTISPECIES: UDP-N-acetylmuramate dehydrogenase [unclassified Eubacterium (in: firmicutes)]|uniref:UDP-N-acetylmuramate dehydrogenase n=1 Tax=Eubacterium TaxID=1730 RepID=UPI0003405531|nr:MULTISPECIES: UDP-N-acetylmuramate dehydrogenase [unclassified Eubacterium (in: firmicutes)]MEE0293980.1 UDP-N-acetylmuramate dehydrogenase [Eubacterium sp.]RGG67222.1 UDP-N-acetylmuramate dehydrogenase [Eubacterium sp. AF17-7]RHR37042.1 UDP-N-acetylmuramate dehydrogenase [Eubacterium sp. AF19-12LB]CDA29546.1 uDP-N-acetylenolpyruvoylglucosamine reductase [Eubacterium sp. CAG:156]